MQTVEAANRSVAALKAAYPARTPDLTLIKKPDHLQLALEAARAGTVLLKDTGLLPLPAGAALVEFASQLDSGILESGGVTGFADSIAPTLSQPTKRIARFKRLYSGSHSTG